MTEKRPYFVEIDYYQTHEDGKFHKVESGPYDAPLSTEEIEEFTKTVNAEVENVKHGVSEFTPNGIQITNETPFMKQLFFLSKTEKPYFLHQFLQLAGQDVNMAFARHFKTIVEEFYPLAKGWKL